MPGTGAAPPPPSLPAPLAPGEDAGEDAGDLPSACASAADGQPIFIAIATLVVGLLIGFLIGVRSKQIAAALAKAAKAILSLPSLLKIKAADAGAGLDNAEAMKDGEDEPDEEEMKNKDAEENFEDFLQTGELPGLEDHVDLEVNPVIMYNIKKAKDAQQQQVRRESLAAEGLTEDEIETKLLGGGAADAAGAKPNALAVLIAMGARVEPVKGGQSEDNVKRNEMRRKQRNINAFLSKTLDINTSITPNKEAGKGGQKKNALDVARDTKHNPYGNASMKRVSAAARNAKSARALYRKNKNSIQSMLESVTSLAFKNDRLGFDTIKSKDIATLAAEEGGKSGAGSGGGGGEGELVEEEEEEEGEEEDGEEGEEGEEDGDDAEELAA